MTPCLRLSSSDAKRLLRERGPTQSLLIYTPGDFNTFCENSEFNFHKATALSCPWPCLHLHLHLHLSLHHRSSLAFHSPWHLSSLCPFLSSLELLALLLLLLSTSTCLLLSLPSDCCGLDLFLGFQPHSLQSHLLQCCLSLSLSLLGPNSMWYSFWTIVHTYPSIWPS